MILHAGVSISLLAACSDLLNLSLSREKERKREKDVSKDRQGIQTNSPFFSMQSSSQPASPVFKNI